MPYLTPKPTQSKNNPQKYQTTNPYAILEGSPSTCASEAAVPVPSPLNNGGDAAAGDAIQGPLKGEEFSDSEHDVSHNLSSSSDWDAKEGESGLGGKGMLLSMDEEEHLEESIQDMIQDETLSLEGIDTHTRPITTPTMSALGESENVKSPPNADAAVETPSKESTLMVTTQDRIMVKEQQQDGEPSTPPSRQNHTSMDQEEWQTCLEETPKKNTEEVVAKEATRSSSSSSPKKQLEPEEEEERYYELIHPIRGPSRRSSNDSQSSSVSSLTFDQYESSSKTPRKGQQLSILTTSPTHNHESSHIKPLYPSHSSSLSPARMALEQRRQKSERLTRIREKVQELQAENSILKQKNQALLEARNHSTSMMGPAHGVGNHSKSASGGSGPSSTRLNQIYYKVQEVTKENECLKESKDELQSQVTELKTKLQQLEIQRQEQFEIQKSPSIDLSLYTNSIATSSGGSLSAARQKLDQATESVFSRVRSIAESRNALAKQREQYFSSKKNFETEGNSSRSKKSPPVGDAKTRSIGTPASAPVTSNDRQKANGLVITRKLNRSDRKVQQMTQRIAQLEFEQMEDKRKVQEARKAHQNDLQQVTQLELESVQQRTLIASLQRQVKQKDQSIEALEDRVQDMGSEIMDLKELHELEQEELQNAYEELKSEAAKLVTWLKTQLAEYQDSAEADLPFQSRDIPFSINPVRSQSMEEGDDSDLDSLTPSEKRTLLNEIARERNQWLATENSVEERVAALRTDMIGSNSRAIIPELNQTFDSADEPSMF